MIACKTVQCLCELLDFCAQLVLLMSSESSTFPWTVYTESLSLCGNPEVFLRIVVNVNLSGSYRGRFWKYIKIEVKMFQVS